MSNRRKLRPAEIAQRDQALAGSAWSSCCAPRSSSASCSTWRPRTNQTNLMLTNLINTVLTNLINFRSDYDLPA